MKTILLKLLICISPLLAIAQADPFKGFKIMQVPRTNVPIGAIWSNSGPVGQGAAEADLNTSDSFSAASSATTKNFIAGLNASLSTYLGINAGLNSSNNSTIELVNFKVVRLASIDVLKQNLGNEIIYEGLMADKVSVTTEKSNAASIKINFAKISNGNSLQEESQAGNKVKFTANGTNLFLAYRVIKLSKHKQASKRIKLNSQNASGNQSLKLSSTQSGNVKNYSVTICPCNVIECAARKRAQYKQTTNEQALRFLNDCSQSENWMIKVLDNTQVNYGSPKEILYWEKLPFDIWNMNYPLSYNLTSSGFLIDYLNIEHLYLEALPIYTGGYLVSKGKNYRVNLVSHEIKFIPVIPKGVSGW